MESVSGSSTSLLRGTRTVCLAVRERTKLQRGTTVSLAHASNFAPSKALLSRYWLCWFLSTVFKMEVFSLIQ